jgi:hypothetical protein
MTDRRNREHERLDRLLRDEEEERRAETERRGEELKEAWRKRRPLEDPDEDRLKRDKR